MGTVKLLYRVLIFSHNIKTSNKVTVILFFASLVKEFNSVNLLKILLLRILILNFCTAFIVFGTLV
jgi:hypothetical protein